jgi:hypothetical protein
MIRTGSGYERAMSDYSEHGAIPVEDAAVDDPPTEEEVRRAQERKHPDQAATATYRPENAEQAADEVRLERDPDAGELPSDTGVQAERQAEGLEAEHEHEHE